MSKTKRLISILLLAVAVSVLPLIAADFPVTTVQVRQPIRLDESKILGPGQTIQSQFPNVVAMATKACPAGKWCEVRIRIHAVITDTDPRTP